MRSVIQIIKMPSLAESRAMLLDIPVLEPLMLIVKHAIIKHNEHYRMKTHLHASDIVDTT